MTDAPSQAARDFVDRTCLLGARTAETLARGLDDFAASRLSTVREGAETLIKQAVRERDAALDRLSEARGDIALLQATIRNMTEHGVNRGARLSRAEAVIAEIAAMEGEPELTDYEFTKRALGLCAAYRSDSPDDRR